MNKIRIFCIIFSFLVASCCANPMILHANALPVLVEHEEYEEITDPYELLQLALQQNTVVDEECSTYSNEADEAIIVTQLIESKTFSNGSQEKAYATTGFLVLDENGQEMTREQLLAFNAEADLTGNETMSGGNYSLIVSCTAYWEWKSDVSTWARCTHTVNQVVGNTSGQHYVKKLNCAFKATNDHGTEPVYIDQVFIDYPTPYVMYTATNPNRMFFLDSPYFSEIAAGVIITYDDESTYQIYIDIKAAIKSSGWH